jgi:hypothetical protein
MAVLALLEARHFREAGVVARLRLALTQLQALQETAAQAQRHLFPAHLQHTQGVVVEPRSAT